MEVKANRNDPTYEALAKAMDHALNKPAMGKEEVLSGCAMAREYRIGAVSVKPCYLPLVVQELKGTGIAVGTVVSFPHGSSTLAVKVFDAEDGVANGATELDMVINLGALCSGEADYVREEVRRVVDAIRGRAILKVIIETAFLTNEQKVLACKVCEEGGAHFVKTSTGYGPGGATVADVRLMRRSLSAHVQVKAAGGIRTLEQVQAMLEAGATRIGTSSTEVILKEYLQSK